MSLLGGVKKFIRFEFNSLRGLSPHFSPYLLLCYLVQYRNHNPIC